MHGDAGVPGHGYVPPPPGQGVWAGPPAGTPGALRWITAVAAVAAAVLAVVGGLLPITETRPPDSLGSGLVAGRTGWAAYRSGVAPSVLEAPAPLEGLLPTVAAVLLVVAAGLALTGRHRMLGAAGATLLVGSVASVWIDLLPTKAYLEQPLPPIPGLASSTAPLAVVDIGAGTWLLLVAGIVGLLILVLVALPAPGRSAPPWPPAPPPGWWPPPPPGWSPPGPPYPGPGPVPPGA